MIDLLLSWRNIWRNKRRSALTIAAIAFASGLLVFMLSFQFGTYEDMINASVKLSSGHIQIMHKGYHNKSRVRKVVKNPEEIMSMLRTSKHVTGLTQRSEAYVIAQHGDKTTGTLLMGIDSSAERDVSGIQDRIIEGGFVECCGRNNTILGYLLAEKLKLSIADEVTLLGLGRDGSITAMVLTVVGIFKTGFEEYDRNVMMIDDDDFDRLFYMDGSTHRIVVMLDSPDNIEAIMTKIKESELTKGLDIMSWEELQPGIKQSIKLDMISGFVMYAILIIVVAFSILNTFLMAIFERTKEFGVLLSLGAKPLRLVKIVLSESMIITLIGLVIGMSIGSAITVHYADAGIAMEGMEMMKQYGLSGFLYPKLTSLSLFMGSAMVACVTFLAALYPALRITRLRPVDAVRGI